MDIFCTRVLAYNSITEFTFDVHNGFIFVLQEIKPPKHCRVLWNIIAKEERHRTSDLGDGKVQR